MKRRRRHFLLEMPQIASRGNFIVTRIFTRPIDRTTFCQSGSEMPEARRTTRPRIWKRSRPDNTPRWRDTILMDISKCATTHHRYFSFLTLTLRRVLAEDRFLLHLPRRSHVRTRNTGNRGRRMSRQTSSLSRSLILFKQ